MTERDIFPSEEQSIEQPPELVRSEEISKLIDNSKNLPPGKHTYKLTGGTILIIDHNNPVYEENGAFKAAGTQPEIHLDETDEITCRVGTMTIRTGGTLFNALPATNKDGSVRPNELIGDGIIGGIESKLNPGDMMRIPAGVPHLHSASKDEITAATFTKAAKKLRF